jgi:lipopolysaccharide transport system ATP-binding protein
MSNIALQVEGLGKKYRIGERREAYKTLRDGVASVAADSVSRLGHLFGRNGSLTSAAPTDYWALRDVSFDVKHGEVVGIIGKNGAGKSTLLKILSRITEPTEGRARVFGRVGSLLEVGTGFHPELTGRENIYMNGAILGMSRADIDRKFDEIVAFAEVDTYLDTPVKRYSSGMQLRLGFAVAAHMEPEILIVDEVLAVGDAQFQKKCMGKIGDVARGGRTVLFVSHNIAAVQHLCSVAVLLSNGRVAEIGSTANVVRQYLTPKDRRSGRATPSILYSEESNEELNYQILQIVMLDDSDQPLDALHTWDYVKFRIEFRANKRTPSCSIDLQVASTDGIRAIWCSTQPDSNIPVAIEPGRSYVECTFPQWPLACGTYLLSAALAIPNQEWLTPSDNFVPLEVMGRDVFQSGRTVPSVTRALIAARHTWSVGSPSATSGVTSRSREVQLLEIQK